MELAFFFHPHVLRAWRLALARTRTQVIQLRAQCTDHWTTESHGIGVPMVQLTTHVKSSTLYGCTIIHPNFFGLMGYYYFVQIWVYALQAPLLFISWISTSGYNYICKFPTLLSNLWWSFCIIRCNYDVHFCVLRQILKTLIMFVRMERQGTSKLRSWWKMKRTENKRKRKKKSKTIQWRFDCYEGFDWMNLKKEVPIKHDT